MEELFEKLQKKEEAIAKLEVERRKGRTTPATDGDSATSNPQSTLESPAADGSTTSGTFATLKLFLSILFLSSTLQETTLSHNLGSFLLK